MDSGWDTLTGGLPHSEISGSTSICRLPGAFRRLSRLSSPVVAKAFTVCASSLDPLTPSFPGSSSSPQRASARHRFPLSSLRTTCIVKEQFFITQQKPARKLISQLPADPIPSMHRIRVCWWSQAGSNRRPPACKADALPTELWPLSHLVGLGGLEPPTSPLSGVRSNHLSYRPASGF